MTSLRRNFSPYAGVSLGALIAALAGVSIVFTAKDYTVIFAVLILTMLWFLWIGNQLSYAIKFNAESVCMSTSGAFMLPLSKRVTCVEYRRIEAISYGVSTLSKMLIGSSALRVIEIKSSDAACRISLKHFLSKDILTLIDAISKVRPDLAAAITQAKAEAHLTD